MDNILASLSKEMEGLVQKASRSLMHIYTDEAAGRTGLALSKEEGLTVAAEAEIGETVRFVAPEGAEGAAEVTGFDETTGLVLVTLRDTANLEPATLASTTPAVGSLAVSTAYPSTQSVEARLEMVRCVGKPLRLPAGRKLRSYLQSDALGYPGFSGAPLIAPAGEVLGLALPAGGRGETLYMTSGEVQEIAEDLRHYGRIVVAYLGVRGRTAPVGKKVENRESGLLLIDIEADSPAEKAGLQLGDIVLTVDGTATDSVDSLLAGLIGPGEREIVVTFLRGGSALERTVRLTERPRGRHRRR